MDCVVPNLDEQKDRLNSIIDACTAVAVKETGSKVYFEENIDNILDDILEVKNLFRSNADTISGFLPSVEKLTWTPSVDEEFLTGAKEIISGLKGINNAMIRNYDFYNQFFDDHNIDREEIDSYKLVADDVLELANDFNSIFFVLPFDQEFQALIQKLNDL